MNSLHGQGILDPGKRIVIEGVADDGTIEAIRIADAPGFALGVQWHAEFDPQRNPINRALFQAFGEAVSRASKRAALIIRPGSARRRRPSSPRRSTSRAVIRTLDRTSALRPTVTSG